MPGRHTSLPSRVFMDGYKRLSAAVIRRSVVDALDGNLEAVQWLRGAMMPWSEVSGMDVDKIHARLDELLKAESLQQFLDSKKKGG